MHPTGLPQLRLQQRQSTTRCNARVTCLCLYERAQCKPCLPPTCWYVTVSVVHVSTQDCANRWAEDRACIRLSCTGINKLPLLCIEWSTAFAADVVGVAL